MGRRKDQEQDQRLDDLEGDGVHQIEVDDGQDQRLDQVEASTAGVNAELPGINTPTGAEQRLKLSVPSPDTMVTLGAIGNADAGQHKFGPAGFSLRTVKNFAAEVHERTILDSTLDITVHTPETLTGVSGKFLHFSTNGDYQLGTKGGLNISAASGAGFTDPAFTCDPQMAVPDPPAIDTEGPRKTTEIVKKSWESIFKAWETYQGATALAKMRKDGLSKGIAKDTWAGKTSGLYSLYNNGKKVFDGLWMAGEGALAAFNHFYPSEKKPGPGKPKVTIYGDDGVTLLSPSKVSIFSSIDGVAVESPHKVGIKAGISASMKAGCDSSLFAFVSAKIESLMVAAVKGKVVTIDGELTEMLGKKQIMISSKGILGVEAETSVRVSAKTLAELSGDEVVIGAKKEAYVGSENILILHSTNTINVLGDKKTTIRSDELVEIWVKNTGFTCKDGEFRFGCDQKVGVKATSSQANIGTQKSFAIFKDGGFEIKGGGPSKIKADNINLC